MNHRILQDNTALEEANYPVPRGCNLRLTELVPALPPQVKKPFALVTLNGVQTRFFDTQAELQADFMRHFRDKRRVLTLVLEGDEYKIHGAPADWLLSITSAPPPTA